MSAREPLAARRSEFESHVWNHSEDVFQADFDMRQRLVDSDLEPLRVVVQAVRDGADDDALAGVIKRIMTSRPEHVYVLMQAVGLTRNKIITDLKAALPATAVPSKAEVLHRRPEVWMHAGRYLALRLRTVLAPIAALTGDALDGAFEALNQATWPGWIRQERAKRQGHEAEHRVAVVLASLGIPFVPEEKATNPLCPDAQIEGVSYDIVVPNLLKPVICVKATVHTSNIGQYGESKDALEIAEARESLDSHFSKPPTLLAMIDGVGFRSNRAGLDGVLEGADEFCQFKTLWKVGVLGAAAMGKTVELFLPDANEHRPFLDRYKSSIRLKTKLVGATDWLEAGEGFVRLV